MPMKRILKENLSLSQLLAGVLVLTAIGGFCVIKDYPLIIPVLMLFFSLHLLFIKKANYRIFLNLGLLLALTLFMAHGVVHWGGWSPYYIPIAVVGMMTMILFNDLELMFLMSLLASWMIVLVVGGDIGMLITYFLGSLVGSYSVRDARRIATVINAGVAVAAVQIFCTLILTGDAVFISPRGFSQIYIKPFVISGYAEGV
jgi:membrane-associated HD superfamily phosphohydrolase